MINPGFWRGRRVFLTGETGFKGAWLAFWLRRMGAEVAGYSVDIPTVPSLFTSLRLAEDIRHVDGDVRNCEALSAALVDTRPDIIIHAAAQSLVRRSYDHPVETFDTNVMGTVNILQAARRISELRAVVIVTSDKCYDNQERAEAYRETDPMGGHDPYSASKGAAELVAASMARSFFNPGRYSDHGVAVAMVRAGNVIGGGDWSDDRLVPDLVRAFAGGVPAQIRNPDSIRPWQHVLDALGGYLRLCECLVADGAHFAGGWNFGPDVESERNVAAIVETAIALWGGGARFVQSHESAVHEARILRLDSSKARQKLKWRPKFDGDTTLCRTFEWYRSFYQGVDARKLAENDIARWEALP